MSRGLASLSAVLLLAACGGTAHIPTAQPQTLELHWRERDAGIELVVRRLLVGRRQWTVELAFENVSGQTIVVDRAHVPGGTRFGLLLLATAELGEVKRLTTGGRLPPPLAYATRFDPPLPRIIRPGVRWSGTMSGKRPLPAGRFVRVVLGRFTNRQETADSPTRFLLVTEHSVRI